MKSDAMLDEWPEERKIIFFDGVCHLCHSFVRFVLERDPEGVFRFAPLQSSLGREVLKQQGLDSDHPSTVVLWTKEELYLKSEASLRILGELSTPLRYLKMALWIPRPLRDLIYDVVARYRYRIFGRSDNCPLPEPEWEERFLDGEASQ